MKSFGDLQGTIMKKDIPIVSFRFDGGILQDFKILVSDRSMLPYTYLLCDGDDYLATELFMDDRVVPETRQGLTRELHTVGIPYYDPVLLIKYNKGISIEDDYWIKSD